MLPSLVGAVPPTSEEGLMVEEGVCVGVVAIVVVIVTDVPATGAADTDPKDSREANARRAVGFNILRGTRWRRRLVQTLVQCAALKDAVQDTGKREAGRIGR